MAALSLKKNTPSNAQDHDFHFVYYVIMSKLWLILVSMVLFIIGGVAYIFLAQKIYEAVATIQVDQSGDKVVKMNQVADEDFKDEDVLRTIEANLERRSLLIRTLKRPEFKNNPFLKDLVARVDDSSSEDDLEKLSRKITAELRRDTRLIDVTVDFPDPATAQNLANGLVDEFIHEMVETQAGMSEQANEFLVSEAERLQKKLSATEFELQQFKGLAELHARIDSQLKTIDALNQVYLEKHPKMIEGRALLKDLETQFLQELQEKYPSMIPEQPKTDADFRQILSSEESRYNVLQQDLTSDQDVYSSVVQRLKETDVTKSVQTVSVRLVEKAGLPYLHVWPKKLYILLAAVILGVIAGVGLAFFLVGLDSSFQRVDDAEEFLERAALAAIPILDPKREAKRLHRGSPVESNGTGELGGGLSRFWKFSNFKQDVPLVLLHHPSSLVAEGFRNLRAVLKLMGKKDDRRTFLFTSAIAAEGKSFVSSNYAISLAQDGEKVLLIDADLRRPTIHTIFGIKSNTAGVTELLSGTAPLEALVHKTEVENLDLLLAGSISPNPSELLSDGFSELIKAAGKTYSRIIIDSAPILAVSDTLLIAGDVQTICLVVRAGRAPRHAVRQAILLLEKSEAKISGFILNCVPLRSGLGYNSHYYYYQSGNKYGNAYGSEVRSTAGATNS
jgi:polysaccharide biosynthesis transport protein